MNRLYIFDETGACKAIVTGYAEDMAEEITTRNGGHSHVISDEAIPLPNARHVNGQLRNEAQVPSAAQFAAEARAKRDSLLTASDWTDTLSAKARLGDATYRAWQDYRQALRDVTKQPGFPQTIVWPSAPQ